MSGKHVRLVRRALIGAYIAIPLALSLCTYQGWLFQSSTSDTNHTNVAVAGLIALVAGTMLAEYAGVFERAATGRDALIGIAYWLGAFVWVVAVVRRVPDNCTGATVLIGPLSALMLGGLFHLTRFAGTCTRSFTTAMLTATPIPVAQPISATSSAQSIPGRSSDSTQSDRVDIAANTGKIGLRLLGGVATFLIVALVLRGTPYDGFATGVFYVGALFLGVMAIRSVPNRAPALSLAPDGIAIRRDLSAIRHLRWSDIIGFEMKSSMGNTFLVIQVRNANELVAQRGLISRWIMGQSLAMFGSPVRIPVSWLQCDPNWLFHTANEMLAASRMSRRSSESNR